MMDESRDDSLDGRAREVAAVIFEMIAREITFRKELDSVSTTQGGSLIGSHRQVRDRESADFAQKLANLLDAHDEQRPVDHAVSEDHRAVIAAARRIGKTGMQMGQMERHRRHMDQRRQGENLQAVLAELLGKDEPEPDDQYGSSLNFEDWKEADEAIDELEIDIKALVVKMEEDARKDVYKRQTLINARLSLNKFMEDLRTVVGRPS